MARQIIRRRAASNPFKAAADRIANDHGGNRRRIEAGLRRIADSFQIDFLNSRELGDPDELLQDSPFNLFLDGIDSTSVGDVFSLVMAVDPVTIAKRAIALRFLFRNQVPLYTIDQLALRVAGFVDYLQKHRAFLVRHGLPPRSFRRCRWLYVQMGRLYDTKMTDSPGPLNECLSRSQRLQFQEQQPYCWLRSVPTTASLIPGHPMPSVGYEKCSYDDASFLKGLDRQDAHRLAEIRQKMLDLKISVLEMLVSMLRRRTPEETWPRAVQRITDSLVSDEADFLLRMDRYYMGLDARQHGAGDANPKMIPGGLTNLFEVIGHCEKELRLGTMASTAESFQTAFPSLNLQRRLRAITSSTTAPYFVIAANGGDRPLDEILDRFISTAEVEQEFWMDYRRRVNTSLANDFDAEVVIRQRIKRPLVEQFIPEVTSFATYIAAKLTAGSPVRICLTDRDNPLGQQLVFVRKGRLWDVGDSNSIAHVRDRKGMHYITQLLRKPGKSIHVAQLNQSVNPPPPRTQGEASYADLHDSQRSKVAPVADRKALKEYYDEANALRAEIEEAQRNNNLAGQTTAEKKLNELLSSMKRLVNIKDQSREFQGQNERLRKSIGKGIKDAIEEIQSVHPTLGSHLAGAIHKGQYCKYDPRPIPEWKLD